MKLSRKIAVVGSRTYPVTKEWWDTVLDDEGREKVKQDGRAIVESFIEKLYGDIHIVSGGAKGPDTWAVDAADARGLRTPLVIRPNWKKYGGGAGFKRNSEIVAAADDVVAFWDLESKGTFDTMKKAAKAEKDLLVFGPDGKLFFYATQEDYKGGTPILDTMLKVDLMYREWEKSHQRTDDPSQGQGNQAGVHT